MPSMPGSGTGVPPVEVVLPPLVVEPPVEVEVVEVLPPEVEPPEVVVLPPEVEPPVEVEVDEVEVLEVLLEEPPQLACG